MTRKQHRVRRTLLVVGEGDSEEAFLKHLRDLYCGGGGGVAVTVRNAHGKGPENVVDHTIRQARTYSYDGHVAFLDTDIPWTDKLKKEARKAAIEMVGSSPCLEGLLLSILGKRPPEKSDACKKHIKQLLDLDLTERASYGAAFSKAVLESARTRLPELDRLLRLYEGRQ
ncbi:MAG: hypothetical protein KUL87_02275 [Pseudomonas sp.]|nr:hypothetical protein [Pseudomonas sp.]